MSCQKTEQDMNSDVQSVLDNLSADQAVENIFSTVNDYALNYLGTENPKIDTNIIVTINPQFPLDSFPKTMIIDYGNGVACHDGCNRKGKISITFDGKWSLENSDQQIIAAISFNSFYIDNNQIIGSMEMKNLGSTGSGPEFLFSSENSKIKFVDGQSTSWSMNRSVHWIAGYESINDLNDDVLFISGTITGVSRQGTGYYSEIMNPLELYKSCFNGTFTKGRLEVTPQGLSTRTVDFGEGNCDREASVTINGLSINVTF